jgi:type II secretory pathway pseudopilin PulG
MNGQRGFTYLGVLFAVAFIGIGLAATGTAWSIGAQREKEKQLLFVGEEFRNAIRSYHRNGPSGVRLYPRSLQDLLEDNRNGLTRRHIRQIYVDPISNSRDWKLITLGDNFIIGVSSPASGRPIKRANFSIENAGLTDTECYCEWRFVYLPNLQE